jgi:MFS transporter, DHA2 family, multidrug resistance protein
MTSSASAVPMSSLRLGVMTFTLVMPAMMQVLDSAVMSVALTQMQGTLQAAQDQVAWVLTSYLIAVALLTPLWGSLAGRFGRKPLFLFAILGFTVASIFAGLSDSMTEICIMRFIQGLFGAALVPFSQASLYSLYKKEYHGIAMSWWGVGIMIGPVLGPTLGGYITELYNWRFVFFLNLPVGALAFVLIWTLMPRPGAKKGRKFSYLGYATLALAVASLQFVLDRGERLDWFSSQVVMILIGGAIALFWVFLVDSFTSPQPFIDPSILRNRNFVCGMGLRVVFGIMLFGSLVLVPPFLQKIVGYPILESGLILAPRGLATMVASIIAGRMVSIFDPRKMIAFGMSCGLGSLWLMSYMTPDSSREMLTVLIMMQGFGFAFFFVPVSIATFSDMTPAQRDTGTSFFALTGNIGRSVGIAMVAGFLAQNTQLNRAVLNEHISPFNSALQHMVMPDKWNMADTAGLASLSQELSRQAAIISYSNDFRLLALIILGCMPLLLLMRNPNRKPYEKILPSSPVENPVKVGT